jgi:uncharacterized protein involved in exopolysaccharide biosynthesis
MNTDTGHNERKLTFIIDDETLFNGHKAPATGEPASLLELATALAHRKWFILKTTAGAGIVGLAVAFLLPTWYTAETRILPPQQQQSSAAALMVSSLANSNNMGALAGGAGKDLLRNPNDLYIGMLKTRPIADALIKRFDLEKLYRVKDMTGARKELSEHTDIVSEKNGMISISVEAKDKKRAADMANAYVEELRNLTRGLALTEASQRRLFYEDQLKQAKDDLANAEMGLKQAQQKTGVISPDAQSKALIEGVGELRAQIVAKEVELQAMRSFATDKNPDVGLAQQELAGMKTQLRKLERQTGDPGNYDIRLKDVPQAQLDYIRAAREVKFREMVFELLAKQFEAARIDEAKDAALIQVVEPAVAPERKSSPRRAFIFVLSALTGFLLGCLAALTGWWRRHIQIDPERSEQLRAFRTAVLGR